MALQQIADARTAGIASSKVCDVLNINERTYRRWSKQQNLADGRLNAKPCIYSQALSAEDKQRIIKICCSEEFASLPPSQIVPILADRGVYIASEATFYRVLRAADLLHHRGKAKMVNPDRKTQPKAHKATAPNQVWSWDITYLPSTVKGQFYYLYLILDVYSRYIVGWEVHECESAEYAAQLINKACLRHGVNKEQLVLHSDNGSPMKGSTMLAMLQGLGVAASFSRPRVSNDNPYSESAFRTLKYCSKYPNKPFVTLNAAQEWVHQFVGWYNTKHRHSGIRFVTPEQRFKGLDVYLLSQRKVVYEQVKQQYPHRWKGRSTRNWEHQNEVWLNPPKEQLIEQEKMRNAA